MSKLLGAAFVLGVCGLGVFGLTQVQAKPENHKHDEAHPHVETAQAVQGHDKYGHRSAIYMCGDDQLQTTYSKTETSLSFRQTKVNVSRDISEGTETFLGSFEGNALSFTAKGYDGSIKIGAETVSCEKLSCIPLDGPIL